MKSSVSIITPVYNVPVDYLESCRASVFSSTYINWEWIIVDDGSTDPEILTFYSSLNDYRVRILHSEHRGVSYARNLALKSLDTDYFLFLDADDVLSPNCIENGILYAQQYDADIVIGKVLDFTRVFSPPVSQAHSLVTFFTGSDDMAMIRKYTQASVPPKDFPIDGYRWSIGLIAGKIAKTSLLKDISFNENLTVGEDFLFFAELFMKVKSVVFIDEFWYGYRQHTSSTMAQSSLNTILAQMASWQIIYEVWMKKHLDNQSIGMRYLAAIINRIIYHPNRISWKELHEYLLAIENTRLFGISQCCTLSEWQLSKKRKIICVLIQRKMNWIATILLLLVSRLRNR